MNYSKIEIKCLFHNPEENTKTRENIGEDVQDSDLIERIVYFYNIDTISPRLDNEGKVIGSIIYSGYTEFTSKLTIEEIDKIIVKNNYFKFKN